MWAECQKPNNEVSAEPIYDRAAIFSAKSEVSGKESYEHIGKNSVVGYNQSVSDRRLSPPDQTEVEHCRNYSLYI